jgi:hypothetical protein
MSLSPATVDLLIITITEGVRILGKVASGEKITKEDLKLETWDETRGRILADVDDT